MGCPVLVLPDGTAHDWVPSGLVKSVPEHVVCRSKAYIVGIFKNKILKRCEHELITSSAKTARLETAKSRATVRNSILIPKSKVVDLVRTNSATTLIYSVEHRVFIACTYPH